MVEFHRIRWELNSAVQARNFSQLIKEPLVAAPVTPLPFYVRSFPGSLLDSEPRIKKPLGANSMAVRAYDVAFRRLHAQFLLRHQRGTTGHQVEQLRRWIAVVEVHLVWLESAATVGARNVPPFAEHLHSPGLADANSEDLGFAIAPVVRDVRGALVSALGRHRPFLERMF